MKKILFLCLLIFFNYYAIAQNTTARLTIESGSSVFFNINTFDKYNNGTEYTNWTRLRVYFIDTTNVGGITAQNWQLNVEALTANMVGDIGNLDLNVIELSATCGDAISNGIVALDGPGSAVKLLNTGNNNVSSSLVQITYYCGQSKTVTNTLLGKQPDHYVVDIIYTLERDP